MAEHFSFGSWDIDPVPRSSAQRALARAVGPTPTRFPPRLATARLHFDSASAPAPGVRGLRSRRHCVYELEGEGATPPVLEIMVEQIGRRDGWSVVGQVFRPTGEGWSGCRIELSERASGGKSHAVHTNEWGEFALAPAEHGPWRLGVSAGGRRYTIAPVLMP